MNWNKHSRVDSVGIPRVRMSFLSY